jgi:hypothetical protein
MLPIDSVGIDILVLREKVGGGRNICCGGIHPRTASDLVEAMRTADSEVGVSDANCPGQEGCGEKREVHPAH